MASLRPVLLIALMLVGYLLWQQWDQPEPQATAEPATSQANAADQSVPGDVPASSGDDSVPAAGDQSPPDDAAPPSAEITKQDTSGLIEVTTDVLRLFISPTGGEIARAELLDYPRDPDHADEPVVLFERNAGETYVAQSGLVSSNAPAPSHQDAFTADASSYTLADGEDRLVVRLRWQEAGISVEKRYILNRSSYLIEQQQTVSNASGNMWQGRQYAQLQRTPPEQKSGFAFTDPAATSFHGVSVRSEELGYEKFDFDDLNDQPFNQVMQGGWLSLVEHYFISAWIAPNQSGTQFQIKPMGNTTPPRYLARFIGPNISVADGDSENFAAELYVGPKLQDSLADIAPGLELTVDYGMFTILAEPLFWTLDHIHDVVGNWGWSIILLTILVKLLFFKLTETQFRSMARMRKLQPRIQTLRERFKDDRQKLSEAMMDLYRKEKVNPLGGCLPLLVQIPVFIALYWVLRESVELRHASFILWLDDLSAPDPYFILPIIMGVAGFAQQQLNPMPSADPMQRRIMMALPLVMTVMFAFFQAGLVLYWTTNQLLGLAQQWVITRRIENGDKKS